MRTTENPPPSADLPEHDFFLAPAVVLLAGLAFFALDLWIYFAGAPHLSYGVTYLNNLIGAGPARVFSDLAALTYYPPLYYAFVGLAYLGLGFDYTRILAANAVFVPLGALYLTLLARRTGLGGLSFLPGLVLLALPGTVLATRQLAIEMPLLLFVPAFLYHLQASCGLQVRGHVLLAGVFASLGMLTKWTFPAYVLGAVILEILRRREGGGSARPWWNLVILIGTPLALAGWWYALRMDWPTFFASAGNDPDPLRGRHLDSLGGYLSWLAEQAGGPTAPWVLGTAAVGVLVGAGRGRWLGELAALVLLPVAILALPVHGEARYLYPLLPSVALVLSRGVARPALPSRARFPLTIAMVAVTVQAHFLFLAHEAVRPRGLREGTVGVRAETDLFARYLLARVGSGEREAVGLAVHPIWHNIHTACENLMYQLEFRGGLFRFGWRCRTSFDYAAFRDDLRGGRLDVLILDCGADGDCLAVDRTYVEGLVAMMAENGYVSQMDGTVSRPFAMADLAQDLALIRERFVEVLHLPLGDGTHTRLLFSRELLARLARGHPAHAGD